MKTWNRYMYTQLSRNSLLCLIAIFVLYSLFDLSTHLSDFCSDNHCHFDQIFLYYGCSLVREQGIFLTLAILLSSLFTAVRLTTTGQMIALQAASISAQRIYRPILVIGIGVASLLLVSQQWILPKAEGWIRQFDSTPRKHTPSRLHSCQIDSSRLFFSSYNASTNMIEDCVWLFHHRILRCKQIEINDDAPIIHYGYLFAWNEHEHRYQLQTSMTRSRMTSHQLRKSDLFARERTPNEMSLLELAHLGRSTGRSSSQALSLLFHRSSLCLLPLFLSMIWTPMSIDNSRRFSPLNIILLALLSLIVVFASWGALLTFGEHHVISPQVGFSTCSIILAFIAIIQWRRLC